MPAVTSISSRPSIRASSDGFSMLELLVALTVLSFVGAAALSLALSSRGVFEQDQQRTAINQNLRSGIDLLGIDVRQAGERLTGSAPAVEIVNGTGTGPDQLILRRNVLDYVLPVCKDINNASAADAVFIAKKGGNPPPGCAPVLDSDNDGWPDNIEAWRNYRLANGGAVLAYIYDPVTKLGEFFTYDDEDNATFKIHRLNSVAWTNDYSTAEQPRIYILEQKRYVLSADVLQYILNEDTAHPYNLVNHMTNFQAQALLVDGTVLNSMPNTTDWTKLQSVQLTLVGAATFSGRTLRRTVTSRFFPRNILSSQ